ncbi:MAG TPA: hypothetical protein PLD46_01620 [Hyphomicrobium sp.]|nr:hypothetical protein [Hyphomicrobium sp.]
MFESLVDDMMASVEPNDTDSTHQPPRRAHAATIWSVESLAAEAELTASAKSYYPADEWLDDVAPEPLQLATDPESIGKQLGLVPGLSADQVAALRRRFALQNHPDTWPTELRITATERMMTANALCDAYLVNVLLMPRAR